MNIPANNKMLYFNENEGADGNFDTAQEAVCYPASSFLGFGSSTTTALQMHFKGLLAAPEDANDVITLTLGTADTHKEVMQAITNEIAFGNSSMISIADDMNSVYADSRITACAISVTAVD